MQSKQDVLDNLIVTCAKEIEHKGVTIASANKSISPMVLVYAGEYSINNFELTRNVIDNNWRSNSKYIYHIGITADSLGNIEIKNLTDNTSVKCDQSASGKYFLDEIFSSMLSSPIGTFSRNNIAKVNLIVSANDKALETYIEKILGLETSLNGLNLNKDLYLLITQGGSFEDREATDNCIRSLYKKELDKQLLEFKQIYVLSNRMKNGTILDQYNKKTNFRLIADLLLLLDNDDNDYQLRESLRVDTNKFRTVSYRYVGKPCREIVVVMLKTLLNAVLDTPKREKEEVLRLFENEQFDENYFAEKFEGSLPEANDFQFLPYTEAGLKNLLANFKTSKNYGRFKVDEHAVDNATYGSFSDFFDINYRQFLMENFDADDFIIELYKDYIKKYNHREVLEYFRYEDIVDEACKEQAINIEKQYGTSFYSVLARYCTLKLRNEYLGVIKPAYHKSMKKLYESALNFQNMIVDMQNDISGVCIIESDDIYNSIEDFYSNYVIEYFNRHKKEILDQINVQVKDYEELANILIKIFNKMLSMDTNNILTCGFSEELSNRLGITSTASSRVHLIKQALVSRIDDFTRINVANDNLSEIYDAYLCDGKSNFLREIEAENYFDTNDENSFERVKIFKFNSLRDILGSRMEEV